MKEVWRKPQIEAVYFDVQDDILLLSSCSTDGGAQNCRTHCDNVCWVNYCYSDSGFTCGLNEQCPMN